MNPSLWDLLKFFVTTSSSRSLSSLTDLFNWTDDLFSWPGDLYIVPLFFLLIRYLTSLLGMNVVSYFWWIFVLTTMWPWPSECPWSKVCPWTCRDVIMSQANHVPYIILFFSFFCNITSIFKTIFESFSTFCNTFISMENILYKVMSFLQVIHVTHVFVLTYLISNADNLTVHFTSQTVNFPTLGNFNF